MSKGLRRRPAPSLERGHVARMNGLVNRILEIAETDLTYSEIMARAPLTKEGATSLAGASLSAPTLAMGDAELAERGWTRAELAIAQDGLKNKREVPYYLIAAHERTVARQKLLQASGEQPIEAFSFVVPIEKDQR